MTDNRQDIRAALASIKAHKQCHSASIEPATGALTNGPHGSGANAHGAVASAAIPGEGGEYASTTTLERIRAAHPCAGGWTKLLKHLGKTAADDEPLGLLTVLDSNGLDDALWVLSYAMPEDRLARHFQAWCAEQVLPIFEAERPNDSRVRDQIAMLRNDGADPAARAAARDAAWEAARVAARAVSRAAARVAALDAARVSARDAQERQLRKMLAQQKGCMLVDPAGRADRLAVDVVGVDTSPEAVERLVKDAGIVSAMIHLGEKVTWGRDTDTIDKLTHMASALSGRLTKAQARIRLLETAIDGMAANTASMQAHAVTTVAELDAWKANADALARNAEALGALPDGYCFCSSDRAGSDAKAHEPECQGLRAALAGYRKLKANP